MTPQRRKRNSSKVNLVISLVFHSVIVLALFFFAAREGMLGKSLKKIAVVMVPKEKPPEKPKEKPPEPKPEIAQKEDKPVETVKAAATPPPATASVAPPPVAVAAAPAAAQLAAFDFTDGAKVQQTTITDPLMVYKGLVEFTIRQKWIRPESMADKDFIAEVEVALDNSGHVIGNEWKKGSGDKQWDASVRKAVAQTQSISRPPPKGFPGKFLVRFDVQVDTEPLLSASLR